MKRRSTNRLNADNSMPFSRVIQTPEQMGKLFEEFSQASSSHGEQIRWHGSLSEAQRTCRELVGRVDPTLLTHCGSRVGQNAVMHNTGFQ
jgi:hypothetical protein